jgi:hypothetical protein
VKSVATIVLLAMHSWLGVSMWLCKQHATSAIVEVSERIPVNFWRKQRLRKPVGGGPLSLSVVLVALGATLVAMAVSVGGSASSESKRPHSEVSIDSSSNSSLSPSSTAASRNSLVIE